jgi:leader peptidase (prepilin peptidase)/N-methyltransferase
MVVLEWLPLVLVLFAVFIVGAIFGSFLNVCISRLPQEKSLLWPPGSRCGHCLQPVRWQDNVPLLSYWRLGGRCRACGAPFSIQYFLVELTTALGFAGLFFLVAIANVHQLRGMPAMPVLQPWLDLPPAVWFFFAHHAALFCFLLVVAVCDLDRREIPLSVTFTGATVGLGLSLVVGWPWPHAGPIQAVQRFPAQNWLLPGIWNPAPVGLWPWPVWWPVPAWLGQPGDWQVALLTAVAGLLAGTFLMRAVRWLFTSGLGIEALGLGDADLMMMAGSFLGWQPVVVAFFVAPFPALLLTVLQYLVVLVRRTIKVKVTFNAKDKLIFRVEGNEVKEHRLAEAIERAAERSGKRSVYVHGPGTMAETVSVVERAVQHTRVRRVLVTNLLPFGPSLAIGVMVTCLCWRWIGPGLETLAFHGPFVLAMAGAGAVLMLLSSFALRLFRSLRVE